ncbi:MAG: IclR family transcriptional regulator [Deltaproteobacteria bacterium]|nr:MAG: IclR family transcriptional regulator [Deltaproteobacteria bacterium]
MADIEKGPDGAVRAVNRALEILLAFTPQDDQLTVGELQKRVDLSRPTLYRLLHTLEQSRFLVSSGEPQRFRLGPAVARLAQVWSASHNVASVAAPMLRRVWEESRETVALFVAEGLHRVCMAELQSPQPLSFKRGVGYRERLVLGASGRAILAHTPLVGDELAAYADGVEIDLERYPAELARIRERGFAVSTDELIQGAVAVAAPFFNGANQVAGSIGIFGPTVRLSTKEVEVMGALLVREAAALSHALGQVNHGGIKTLPSST